MIVLPHRRSAFRVSVPSGPYATWYNFSANTIAASNGAQKTSGGSDWNSSAETEETTSDTEIGISQVSNSTSTYATIAIVDASVTTTVGAVHPSTPAYSAYKVGSSFYRIINGNASNIGVVIALGEEWGIRRAANGDFEWFSHGVVRYTYPAASVTMPAEVRGRCALYHEQTLDNIELTGTGWAIP